MIRGLSTLIACSALVLAAGCGSSNSSTTTSVVIVKRPAGVTAGGLKAPATPNYAVPSSSAAVRSGIVPIAYRDITIQPDTVKAKVGSLIVWTNDDSVE